MLIGNEYCQEALSKDGEQQNESHMSKIQKLYEPHAKQTTKRFTHIDTHTHTHSHTHKYKNLS